MEDEPWDSGLFGAIFDGRSTNNKNKLLFTYLPDKQLLGGHKCFILEIMTQGVKTLARSLALC